MKFDPENMKIRICKKCEGLGSVPKPDGAYETCPECEGAGRVLVKTLASELPLGSLGGDTPFDEETMKVKVCKVCDGLGSFAEGGEERECGECNGTGRVVVQKIVTEYRMRHLEEYSANRREDGMTRAGG